MITVSRRRGFLALAFVGALTAAMMAPSEEVARPPLRAAPASPVAPASPAQRRDPREDTVPPLAEFERRIDEKFVVVDVFEARQIAGPAAAPPPAPLPPKLPFSYMGSIEEAGRVKFVLIEGDKLHIVAKGGKFAGAYRLEEVGAEELVLTYLPLEARQSLSKGVKK